MTTILLRVFQLILLLVVVSYIIYQGYILTCLKQSMPTKYKIVKFYGRDKKTEVSKPQDAYFIDVTNGTTNINKLRLMSYLSENQNEVYVSEYKTHHRVYQECYSVSDTEKFIASLKPTQSVYIKFIIAVGFIILMAGIRYNSITSDKASELEYTAAVTQEKVDEGLNNIKLEMEGTAGFLPFVLASEVLSMWRVDEPETAMDYRINYIIADGITCMLYGYHEPAKVNVGLPINDKLYGDLHEYYNELGGVLHEKYYYDNTTITAEEFDTKYEDTLFYVLAYEFAIRVLLATAWIICIMVLIQHIAYYKSIKKYQDKLGIS